KSGRARVSKYVLFSQKNSVCRVNYLFSPTRASDKLDSEIAARWAGRHLPIKITHTGEAWLQSLVEWMIYDTFCPLMKKNWVISTTVALWFGSLLLALAMIRPAAAPAQPKVEEFFDTDYGYFFKYPA